MASEISQCLAPSRWEAEMVGLLACITVSTPLIASHVKPGRSKRMYSFEKVLVVSEADRLHMGNAVSLPSLRCPRE